jgi:transposase
VLNGNSADKTGFPKIVQAYVAQLQSHERPCCIAARDLYSADNRKALSAVSWITRLPEAIQEARDLLQRMDPGEMQPSAQDGYRYGAVNRQYKRVAQRWLVVFSQQAYDWQATTFQQQVGQHQQQAQTQLWHLSHREFARQEAAQVAIAAMEKSWRCHRAEVQLEPVARYGRRGPPRGEAAPQQVRWRVVGQIVAAPEAITAALRRKGKFMMATNKEDAERLPAETLFSTDKAQGLAVEPGFRLLKDRCSLPTACF